MDTKLSANDCEIIDRSILYDGFFTLQKVSFKHRLFKGGYSETVHREILKRGNAVGVLLFDANADTFVLVEQCRIGALTRDKSPWLLELVAGMVELGESAPDVAIRESMEEAGATVTSLIPAGGYWSSPGGTDEFIELFIGAVDSSLVAEFAGLESEHEDIKVHVIPTTQVKKMLRNGEINNAMTLIALQHFYLNEESLRHSFSQVS